LLNQLIQFYSNNATNLHHLTTRSTTCWRTKWRSHCHHRYVTSLHSMYISFVHTGCHAQWSSQRKSAAQKTRR